MPKRVLDVGNCAADHGALRRLIETHFDAQVHPARTADEALDRLADAPADLVLVNRILDADASEGLDVVRRIKADPELAGLPVMLLTNFPDHQQRAVAAGAVEGFGKAELSAPETREKLAAYLA